MPRWFNHVVVRNILGFAALLGVYIVSDYYHLQQRTGFSKGSPYLFLVLLYGWIVFHNRFLFERLFLGNRKNAYFFWTGIIVLVSSVNMHLVLRYGFEVQRSLPQILSFWVYTIAGLGVYLFFRQSAPRATHEKTSVPVTHPPPEEPFEVMVDGEKTRIELAHILYVESLENYVRIATLKKTHLVRLSMKEADQRLPKPLFIRISRSHIVNTSHIRFWTGEAVLIRDQSFRIGKVYKRYVEEQLASSRRNLN